MVGRRDVRRASAREADALTGFTIGGIPPFGHDRRTRVIMDPALHAIRNRLGRRGPADRRLSVAPAILRMLADAHVAPIAEGQVQRAS